MRIRDVLDDYVDGNYGKIVDYEVYQKEGRSESWRERIRVYFVW